MPTIQQLVRKGRDIIRAKSKSRALDQCPQRRGTDPRPTGQPSVDSGHERRSLLVTDGDDFDSLRSAKRIGKGEGLFARNLEDEFNLLVLKTLYEQVGPFQRTIPTLFRASVHGIFRAMIECVESQISRPCGLDSSQLGT